MRVVRHADAFSQRYDQPPTAGQICREGQRLKEQRRREEAAGRATEQVFTACGAPLDSVTEFKYLGRLLSCQDNDWPALYYNIARARKRWAMVSCILVRDGASPRAMAMFYKAVVQSVLLYGCETWNLNDQMLNTLRGFHHMVARRIPRRMPRRRYDGSWDRGPPIRETLEEAGLFEIDVYIKRRHNSLVDSIATRPILELCMNSERVPGSPV